MRFLPQAPKRLALPALLAAAGVLSVLAVAAPVTRRDQRQEVEQLADRAGRLCARAEGEAARTDEDGKSDPRPKTPPRPAKPSPQVERITQRNIFAPPAEKKFEAKLLGVLGDEALFEGNQSAKVGQQVAGATVKQIGPDWVGLEFDGKPMTLQVFGGSGGPSAGPSRGGSSPAPGGRMVMVEQPAPASPPSGPRGVPQGFQLTPEMIEQFKRLPPDVRAKALEEAPPEIREQLRNL